jgi:hypothetical protein
VRQVGYLPELYEDALSGKYKNISLFSDTFVSRTMVAAAATQFIKPVIYVHVVNYYFCVLSDVESILLLKLHEWPNAGLILPGDVLFRVFTISYVHCRLNRLLQLAFYLLPFPVLTYSLV